MKEHDLKLIKGLRVEVRNDDVEKALRKLKKRVQDVGLLLDIKARESYEKPTVERKRKKNLARRRWLKQLESQKLPTKMF